MMNTNALKKTNKRLLTKKDFVEKIIEPHNIDKFKKMKVCELRELYQMTHIIDNKVVNMQGYCFSCLKPLRPDYTSYENYCADC